MAHAVALMLLGCTRAMVVPPSEELTITCRTGVRLAARAWGDARSPTRVLALHGWMDNANTWHLLGPALAHGSRLVAIDFMGHGRSAHAPASAEYTSLEHAYTAYDALDALGWLEKPQPPDALARTGGVAPPAAGFSLLGHSMGGGVACLLASALPEHVQRLALVEGFGPLARPPGVFPTQLRDSLQKRHAAELGEPMARERTYATAEEAATARVNGAKRLPGRQFMSHGAGSALVERGTTSEAADALRFSHDRRLALPVAQPLHEEQVLAILGSICCPTLLIQAADGWPRPEPGFSRRVRSMQPGLLTIVELAQGSHYAHLDQDTASAVQDAIVPFLLGSGSEPLSDI